MAEQWSAAEVDAAVADYFAMLKAELSGQSFNKSEHRRSLLPRLNARTAASIELKHAKISAVLIEMGMPYIDGYKPRRNYQKAVLPESIREYLASHPDIVDLVEQDSVAHAAVPTVDDILGSLEAPPKSESAESVREMPRIVSPTGVNYLERESLNYELGEVGEAFVLNFERARLILAGKENLADRIEQVSATRGPVAGFDVLSLELDGTDRYIEAKTTKYGRSTPFFITANEVAFSLRNAARYHLYRVFGFRRAPRLYTLIGSVEQTCALSPTQYVALPR